jgi:hypothetical protein
VDDPAEPSPEMFNRFAKRLNPPLRPGEKWVRMRGGSFREPLPENVLYDSAAVPARFRSPLVGFRCAKDAK